MSNRVVTARYFVSDWVLIAAAIAVKRNPDVRLSKRAVLAQAQEWYETNGEQLDSGDLADVNIDSPTPREYEQALAWVMKYWPDVNDVGLEDSRLESWL